MSWARITRILPIVLIVAVGILVGIGGYTFVYARGYSYLSDDPEACVNCHVMREQYSSWIVSSHRNVTCNGCHTPHDFVGKYLVKAENGFAHSYAFTFEDVQVFRIKNRSRGVVEKNCAECHQSFIQGTFLEAGTGDEPVCTRCHRFTGHAL